MRTTHTYVLLELSQAAYDEIYEKMLRAGYQHALHKSQADPYETIDMSGIAITRSEDGRSEADRKDRS